MAIEPKEIVGKVLEWRKNLRDDSVMLNTGWEFNQYKMLTKIELYRNSQFESGLYEGKFRKFFYNITGFRCDVETKTIDLDTKDFRFVAEDGQSYWPSWFLEKEFKYWMKKSVFAKLLNQIFEELPIFGTVVLKKIGRELKMVKILNLINEQTAPSLKESSYVCEMMRLTPEELRKMKYQKKSLVEKIISEFKKSDESYIEVVEVYMNYDGQWNRYIVGGVNLKTIDQNMKTKEISMAEILDERFDVAFPYREIHRRRIRGRWLGVGVVEENLEPQIAINELVNLNRKGLHYTQLHIWQTQSTTFNRNLLKDADNGDVLFTDSEITPITTESRDLAHFNQEFQRWISLSDQMTFVHDVLQGERPPSGTPLGTTQIQAFQATTFFEFKRENVAIDLKEIIFNDIIPEFMKQRSGKHTLLLIGEDLDKYAQFVVEQNEKQAILDFVERRGDLPTLSELELARLKARDRILKQNRAEIDLPEQFVKDARYYFDIIITGEEINLATKLQTIQVALQIISANPMLLQNPLTKKIFFSLLSSAGINPMEFNEQMNQVPQQMMQQGQPQQGGSISIPAVSPQQTMMGKTQSV